MIRVCDKCNIAYEDFEWSLCYVCLADTETTKTKAAILMLEALKEIVEAGEAWDMPLHGRKRMISIAQAAIDAVEGKE